MVEWSDRLRVRSGRRALALAGALVLVCTLLPLSFGGSASESPGTTPVVGIGPDLSPDVAGNVLLFLPLGVALAMCLNDRRVGRASATAIVFGVGLAASYSIELLQHFVPGRFASLSDVLSNGAGAGLGLFCYWLWRGERGWLLPAAFSSSVILASIPLQWGTTVHNWDPAYPLLVGNERTGDRPWHGRVLDLTLLDRAISQAEASALSRRGGVDPSDRSLIASYDLGGPCPCPDREGNAPPLEARTGRRRTGGVRGEGLDPTRIWLETGGPAAMIVERIRRTSAFTLSATVATTVVEGRGPSARIVSISVDGGHRNVTVGQTGRDLVVRVRTLVTGASGARPALTVRDVFPGEGVRRLVVTYDGRDLSAYVDDDRASTIRFGVGTAALAPFLGLNARAFPLYEAAYYAMVFVPAGLLVSLAAGAYRGLVWGTVVMSAVTALAVALELALVATSERPLAASALIWGLVPGAAGAAVARVPLMSRGVR